MRFGKVIGAIVALLLLIQVIPADAATKKAQKITWTKVSTLAAGKTATINAKASSKLAVKATSSTPSICSVTASTLTAVAAGTCNFTLSQAGNKNFKPAATIKASVTITATVARSTSDQPDTFPGFQIHPIYVQPSDATDQKYDTNGYIKNLIDDGNALLKREIGFQFPIDSTANGYDIEYMKSKYTTSQIINAKPNQLKIMVNELKPFDNPSPNRKDYVFFIDVPNLNAEYCGWADLPGMAAVVALGGDADTKKKCSGPTGGVKDYASRTWVHEVFHNLGVSHTPTTCDLMYAGTTNCSGNIRIDAARKLYVDATAYGNDVTNLRVWVDHTQDPKYNANCLVSLEDYPLADGTPYAYCPLGTQLVGDLGCYDKQLVNGTLQKWSTDKWVDVGPGSIVSKPWGSAVDFTCSGTSPLSPSVSFTQNSPGTVKFRWIVNDDFPQDAFYIIFAR